MKNSQFNPIKRNVKPTLQPMNNKPAEKNSETGYVKSAIQPKNIADILRQVADMLFPAGRKEIAAPADIKYRPEVMIVIINPQAAFFEPRDPDLIRAEIAAQKERAKEKTKAAEPQQKTKSKSRFKQRELER